MPTHPAVTRQLARVSGGTEVTDLPAPAYYQHNTVMSGTSVYGALGRSLIIHVEGAAGQNAGINQIATQDRAVRDTCEAGVKEGILTKIGSLI